MIPTLSWHFDSCHVEDLSPMEFPWDDEKAIEEDSLCRLLLDLCLCVSARDPTAALASSLHDQDTTEQSLVAAKFKP